ncbi:MAG: VWA domain-containing protein [Planctomycetota bacterium]
MFLDFFDDLKAQGIPVTLREYLDLLAALLAGLGGFSLERFYYLSRTVLVKDEKHFDRFDQVFKHRFEGYAAPAALDPQALPAEWLENLSETFLSEAKRRQAQERGSFDEILEELRKRLAEQKERHAGGSKWIGTEGTSPFGANGYNPAGVRIGANGPGQQRALKVWDERQYSNLDDRREIGTRNFKVALRRLRSFVREGAEEEFDLDATIKATAASGGLLDVVMRPEKRNKTRLLMLLDVGGSMDRYVKLTEELFSAARSEFADLQFFYFHNCVYETLWRDNPRRPAAELSTQDLLATFGTDYTLIVVGDASMSPYEIIEVGGSVEHWNQKSGEYWLGQLLAHFPKRIWLNPIPESDWLYTTSIGMVRALAKGQMEELSVAGLDRAFGFLRGRVQTSRPRAR